MIAEPSLLPVLELEAVTKWYDTEPPVTALAGVTLCIRQGELAAIVGPSGSGKSTLLHVMGTLDRPSSGTVRVTGTAAQALPQMIQQDPGARVVNKADGTAAFENALQWALALAGIAPASSRPQAPR